MATHYTIFIFDDCMGMMNGRTGPEEADHLNKELREKSDAMIFEKFTFHPVGNCLIGEFRGCHPERYKEFFKYDLTYWRDGDHLHRIT